MEKQNINLIVLILGICSFIIPLCGIIGIILYFSSDRRDIKSIIGLVLSIISTLILLALIVLLIIIIFTSLAI